MKKGKVIGKSQILLAVMVVALGAAVWFNMRYSPSGEGTKYLGQAEYVDNVSGGDSLPTSAAPDDYFTTAKKQRDEERNAVKEDLAEAIKNAGENSEAVKNAADRAASIAARETAENNIESLLKAKGFDKNLAIIGDNDINIIVGKEALTASETLQIQDIASSQSGYTVDKIKILTAK